MEDRDIDVTYDVSSFVAELRRLADALESGAPYMIHVDGEDVTVPEDARLSVAHEREDGAVELEFQLTWSLAQGGTGAQVEDEPTQVTGSEDIAEAPTGPGVVDTDAAQGSLGNAATEDKLAASAQD